MDRACSMHGRNVKCIKSENLREEHVEDLGIDGKIILELNSG